MGKSNHDAVLLCFVAMHGESGIKLKKAQIVKRPGCQGEGAERVKGELMKLVIVGESIGSALLKL